MKNRLKSRKRGKNTSAAEVIHISAQGVWILVDDVEYCLDYQHHPWFKSARVEQILNLKQPHPHHLHWPDLDVDLEAESLRRPKDYPLVYRGSDRLPHLVSA